MCYRAGKKINKYSKLQFLEKTAAAVGGVATIKQLIRAVYFQLIFSLLASAKNKKERKRKVKNGEGMK